MSTSDGRGSADWRFYVATVDGRSIILDRPDGITGLDRATYVNIYGPFMNRHAASSFTLVENNSKRVDSYVPVPQSLGVVGWCVLIVGIIACVLLILQALPV
jgi:hypothetical protein